MNQTLPAVEESIGTQLMKALYEEITNLRMPWIVTPQQQQQEVLDRLRAQVDLAVRSAVRQLATVGFNHIAAQIDSLAIKDEAKVVLMMARGSQELHEVADRVGTRALIVFADPAEYTDGMEQLKAQADQADLPLE